MLHRLALLLVLVAFAAGTAYGVIVDGYAYLEGETDHSGIKVVCKTCVNPIPKFTDRDGHFGPWYAILGDRDRLFEYTCECFDTLTRWHYIPPGLRHTLPPVTLERCEIERFCGGGWAQYPYYPPGTEIWFSRDDGKHLPYPTYPIEWWYANFHLTGESQTEYGAFVGFFKLWEIVPLGMRLFAISDLGLDLIYTNPKYGELLAEDNWLDLEFIPSVRGDRWYNITACNGVLLPFAYRLHVTGEIGNPMRLDVDMYSQKAPLIVGGDGYIEIGDGFTYYYSHSRVEVSGTLVLPSGFEEDVEGYAWIDHQWGDFLTLGDTVTWEWFSIQLDDTSDIMVADVWLNGQPQGSFSGGLNFFNADCSTELLEDYTITPERFWTDRESGKTFATQWTITAAGDGSGVGAQTSPGIEDIYLTVTADFNDQVMRLTPGYIFTPCFWEGSCSVSGAIRGRWVSGKAYAELTHSWSDVEPPYCSIDIIPDNPPVIVRQGSSFDFTGILTNNTGQHQTIDVWLMVNVPGIGMYGPVKRLNDVPLSPNETKEAELTQRIPGGAPLGFYKYIAYCGNYDQFPPGVVDSSHFILEVIPGALAKAGEDSWVLTGSLFDHRDELTTVPSDFALLANHPNPFNATTLVSYDLPIASRVRLEVYNLLGERVVTLVDAEQEAGYKSIMWDASKVSSGLYFYRLTAGDYSECRRMMLVK